MFVSILIIAISLTLFLYWFRYTCVLILSTKTSRDYASQIASTNQLAFVETRASLNDESLLASLEQLHKSLDRDYKLVTYLLRHGSGTVVPARSLENRILMVDFQLMRLWYAAIHLVSHRHAHHALLEMTSIVSHLANAMGERTAVESSS